MRKQRVRWVYRISLNSMFYPIYQEKINYVWESGMQCLWPLFIEIMDYLSQCPEALTMCDKRHFRTMVDTDFHRHQPACPNKGSLPDPLSLARGHSPVSLCVVDKLFWVQWPNVFWMVLFASAICVSLACLFEYRWGLSRLQIIRELGG